MLFIGLKNAFLKWYKIILEITTGNAKNIMHVLVIIAKGLSNLAQLKPIDLLVANK